MQKNIPPDTTQTEKSASFVKQNDEVRIYTRVIVWKRYELSNHLGNVLATITDRKVIRGQSEKLKTESEKPGKIEDEDILNAQFLILNSELAQSGVFFEPDIATADDYYPFGMAMPGRTWRCIAPSSGGNQGGMEADGYRYGFGGHEESTELGDGMVTTEYREMDTHIGRWLSIDPKAAKFAGVSPYVAMGNSPVVMVDPDGGENIVYLYITPAARNELMNQQVTQYDANGIASGTYNGVEFLARQTADNLRAACVNNFKVVVLSEPRQAEFSSKKLDDSDVVVFIGVNAADAKSTFHGLDAKGRIYDSDCSSTYDNQNCRLSPYGDAWWGYGANPETTCGRMGFVSLQGCKEFHDDVINAANGGSNVAPANPNFDMRETAYHAAASTVAHSVGHAASGGKISHEPDTGASWMKDGYSLLKQVTAAGRYFNIFNSAKEGINGSTPCFNKERMVCDTKECVNSSSRFNHKPANDNWDKK